MILNHRNSTGKLQFFSQRQLALVLFADRERILLTLESGLAWDITKESGPFPLVETNRRSSEVRRGSVRNHLRMNSSIASRCEASVTSKLYETSVHEPEQASSTALEA